MSVAEDVKYFEDFCYNLDQALEKAGFNMFDAIVDNEVDGDTDKFKNTKYPHLRVAAGGKGTPEGPVDNWLADLEPRTMFVARHRNSNDVDYNQYYVLFKSLPEVVLLKWILPDGKLLDYYVDPVRFSKMFPEHVILGVDKEPNQEPQQEAEVSYEKKSDSDD